MRARVLPIFGVLCAVAVQLSACELPDHVTLNDVIARHAAARGGTEVLEGVKAIEVRVNISEPAFSVDGHYRATRDGKMRIDIYSGDERIFTEAYDGVAGWQQGPGANAPVTQMSAEGQAAVKRGIIGNIFGLHEWPGQGFKLTLGEPEEIDGALYWTIDAEAPDGFTQRLYLDIDTYLIVRKREVSVLHPDTDSTAQRFETIIRDHRYILGIRYGFREEKRNIDSGELVQATEVRELIVNPELDPAIFSRPQ